MDLIHSCCESLSQKGLVSIWMEKKAGLLEGGALSAERALEKLARMRALDGGYLFGGALRYDASAAVASLRPEVYYVVGALYHIEVVLDYDDGVAGFAEALQHVEELVYVGEMETRRRLVEYVKGPAGRPLGELPGELDPLRLAAWKGGRGRAGR